MEKNDVTKRREVPEEVEGPSEEPALLAQLRELNLDLLTPMQALAILAEWKENYK